MSEPISPEIPLAHPAGPTLQYASYADFDPDKLAAARWLIGLAVLSGACVGVCFAVLAHWPFAQLMYATVYAATLLLGIGSSIKMPSSSGNRWLRQTLDIIAGIGLLGLMLTPLLFDFPNGNTSTMLPGISFLLLAATTYRHRLLYRELSSWASATRVAKLGRRLRVLGAVKAYYEAIWLGCCAITLLGIAASQIPSTHGRDFDWLIVTAVASFVGCLIYGILWIWMIIAHCKLMASLRERTF